MRLSSEIKSVLFSFEDMDSAFKPCTLINQVIMPRKVKKNKLMSDTGSGIDRLTSLPDAALGEILSFLPTKEAVATSVLSRRWRRVFTWITNLEFDESPISHCLDCPNRLESFTTFKTFMDGLLQACQSRTLTRFSLKVGKGKNMGLTYVDWWLPRHQNGPLWPSHECDQGCLPELKPMDVSSWFCFPLAHGVKELDLCVHVRKPGKLPKELYSCKTLEVLKLDVNLKLEITNIFFCLPYLKVLHLKSVLIPDGDSLTRLVWSCPSLEDLTLKGCKCETMRVINLSAPLLRRLVINLFPGEFQRINVVLHTPNLRYLLYADTFALHYSIKDLSNVVEAHILTNIAYDFSGTDFDLTHSMLIILKSLSNVQHLVLLGACMQALTFSGIKLDLPVFGELNNLELGVTDAVKWSSVLLDFLNCSPFIERLAFPEGLVAEDMDDEAEIRLAAREYPYWSTIQAVPSCLRSHVKRIVIEVYLGVEWELEVVKYFLRSASVLEEFIIYLYSKTKIVDRTRFESTLKKLPRASTACSIQVR